MKNLTFLFLFLLLLIPTTSNAQPNPTPDWRFGVVETYESPADATELGAAWTRIRFHWGTIQGGGVDTWTPLVPKETVLAEVEAGREVVGLMIGIPDWARGEDLLPAGLYLEHDDPNNLWANFVRELMGEYAGIIHHWILWNEPDIWEKGTPGHTWDGDEADFMQLMRVTYLVAKEVDPNSTIHLPAMTYFWDANFGRVQYLDRLMATLTANPHAVENNLYFDVATAHLYFQAAGVYEIIEIWNGILDKYGIDKPFWLVETNAPPDNDEIWEVKSVLLRVSLNEQANYQPQAIASALAIGAERISIYKLADINSDFNANPEPFGLIRMDGVRRPAFDTAQVAFRFLAGVIAGERQRWDDVGQLALLQADRLTHVVFSRTEAGGIAIVPAIANTALVINQRGNIKGEIMVEEGNVFNVFLDPAECTQYIAEYCMIGGETLYVIQMRDGSRVTGMPLPLTKATPLQNPIDFTNIQLPVPTPLITVAPPLATQVPSSSPQTVEITNTNPIADLPAGNAPTFMGWVWGSVVLIFVLIVGGIWLYRR